MTEISPAERVYARPGPVGTSAFLLLAAVVLAACFWVAAELPEAHGLRGDTAVIIVAAATALALAAARFTGAAVRADRINTVLAGDYRAIKDRIAAGANESDAYNALPPEKRQLDDEKRSLKGAEGNEPMLFLSASAATWFAVRFFDKPADSWAGLVWIADRQLTSALLPAAWVLLTIIRHRAAHYRLGENRAEAVFGELIVFTPIGYLLLPSSVLLCSTAAGAVRMAVIAGRPKSRRRTSFRSFEAKIRSANRTGGEEAIRLRLEAINQLLRLGPDARAPVERELPRLASDRPEAAALVLVHLMRIPPGSVDLAVSFAILRQWMQRPDATEFDQTWNLLERAVQRSRSDLRNLLAQAAGGNHAVLKFRELATRRLVAGLDRMSTPAAAADRQAWDLLGVIAPPGAPTQGGDWWCVLGDLARGRGDLAEAEARYVEGVRLASRPSMRHLAHLKAVRARELLLKARWAEADRLLAEATGLAPEVGGPDDAQEDYRLLRLLGRLLQQNWPDRQLLGELDRLSNRTRNHPYDARSTLAGAALARAATIDFWLAVALVRMHDPVPAVAALRRSLADFARAGQSADPAQLFAARMLSAALEGDGRALAEAGRLLERQYGSGWVAHCPVAPAVVLAAARSHDPLLSSLLARSHDGGPDYAAAARAVAGHELLGKAVEAAEHERTGEALTLVRDARRTMGEG